jgi:hypothetical protein
MTDESWANFEPEPGEISLINSIKPESTARMIDPPFAGQDRTIGKDALNIRRNYRVGVVIQAHGNPETSRVGASKDTVVADGHGFTGLSVEGVRTAISHKTACVRAREHRHRKHRDGIRAPSCFYSQNKFITIKLMRNQHP